ncbi:MAG: HAMP domain-containing protein [Anaerolineae bacterium]|nr:HAMP domain-containing protein [Anaerolineae bacterium]
MNINLRTRLILSFLVTIVVTVSIVILLANVITRRRFTYMVSANGERLARRVAPAFTDYYVKNGSWQGVEEMMMIYYQRWSQNQPPPNPELGNVPPDLFRDDRLLLLDRSGKVVADSASHEAPVKLPAGSLEKGAPIIIAGRRVGTVIVVSALGELNNWQTAFLRQVTNLLLGIGVIITGVGLIVSGFQAQRILAPIKALSVAARHISTGDLSQRIPITSDDELGEMAASFNTMAAELEKQEELRHRVMADIAHELRTPLSVLQIELESLEDGLIEPTAEVIVGLQSEVVHLGQLVNDLRVLSLTDAGELHLAQQPVELRGFLREVTARVGAQVHEAGLTLKTVLPPAPLTVSADQRRLTQILLNLLSNAITHTPAGGTITVTLRQVEEERAAIAVADTGTGIPTADLPHIFERFYQVKAARNGAGTGLGLSIARSLVAAHGGQLWAASAVGEGSTFTFDLPLVAEPASSG